MRRQMIAETRVATMLATAPVAASRPLQTSLLTMSLSTYLDLPFRRRGVNHLGVAAVGIVGPALEEAPVDREGPAPVDHVDRPVATARQHPDPYERVLGGSVAQQLGVPHGDDPVIDRMQDEHRDARPRDVICGGGARPDLLDVCAVVGGRDLVE